jgi:hypothetical protein
VAGQLINLCAETSHRCIVCYQLKPAQHTQKLKIQFCTVCYHLKPAQKNQIFNADGWHNVSGFGFGIWREKKENTNSLVNGEQNYKTTGNKKCRRQRRQKIRDAPDTVFAGYPAGRISG